MMNVCLVASTSFITNQKKLGELPVREIIASPPLLTMLFAVISPFSASLAATVGIPLANTSNRPTLQQDAMCIRERKRERKVNKWILYDDKIDLKIQ